MLQAFSADRRLTLEVGNSDVRHIDAADEALVSIPDTLWKAIETVGIWIGRLDTPRNREALLALIDGFTKILDAIGRIAMAVEPLAPAF